MMSFRLAMGQESSQLHTIHRKKYTISTHEMVLQTAPVLRGHGPFSSRAKLFSIDSVS